MEDNLKTTPYCTLGNEAIGYTELPHLFLKNQHTIIILIER